MIHYKSADELDKMRVAGRITADAVKAVVAEVRAGVTTADLDRVAETLIRDRGATPAFKGYRGFPGSICASINDEIVHGIPSPKRVLKEGDLVSLDFGAIWEGFVGDSAVTVIVGEPPSAEAEKLVRVTEDSLDAAIGQIRPGARLSDVGAAVQQVAEGRGSPSCASTSGTGSAGHARGAPGAELRAAPGRGPALKPGLVIAVEPMVNIGGWETRQLDDGWTVVTADGSLSAHFEHTIAVTEDGHEVLTARS